MESLSCLHAFIFFVLPLLLWVTVTVHTSPNILSLSLSLSSSSSSSSFILQVKAVLSQKFHELACSNISTPSSSSECTLHTSDFASTQSDISQMADGDKVEKVSEEEGEVEEEEEEEEEDAERIASSCSELSSKQSSAHGSYRLLECEEEEKEDGPFHQLKIASVESMITPTSTATDLAQPCEEAWIENVTSAATGCSKLEAHALGEMTQVEAELQMRGAEDSPGEDQADISELVEEGSTLPEKVVHHQILLSPQGSVTSQHANTPDTSSPLVDVLSHSLSALGHVSSGVPSNHTPSDPENTIRSPSPSSFSSSSSSLSGICCHHSEKCRTREQSNTSPTTVKLPTVTLNLPASSPLSYHFGSVVSAAQSTTIPLSHLSAPTSHSSLETSIGEEE